MRFPILFIAAILFTLSFNVISFASSHHSDPDKTDLEELLERHQHSGSLDLFSLWKDIGDRAGFEIGNGRKVIRNQAGSYLMKIYKDWEVGILGKFTEVISPMYEGIPRARLQINVMHSNELQSIDDLIDNKPSDDWKKINLGMLKGIQQDQVLSNGVRHTEVRVYRGPGEVIVMTFDGRAGEKSVTAYDKIQHALTSFKIMQVK